MLDESDKSVAEATGNRKEENADYKELMTNDGTAKAHNLKVYKAPRSASRARRSSSL